MLLRNATNTGFDSKVDFATGLTPYSVSVGDFNGDGKTDLAVTNMNSNTVSVLLRNATNTGFDSKVDFATSSTPTSFSVGDFNGDGKTDLAVTCGYSVSVLLRNAANTGFDRAVISTSNYVFSVSVGDFNGDGKTDLAVVANNHVSLLLRKADNTGFDPGVDLAIGSKGIGFNYGNLVSVGDINGDGKTDLAVVNSGSNTVSVLLNNTIPNATLTITDHTNLAPTFTTFAAPVATGNEDTQISISFDNLKAQGNEADVDGTVDSFIVKAVSTGSLLIGTSLATATAWNATTNNIVDATRLAFWTPAANANGTLNAFTVVAKDNGGLESATALQATINVAVIKGNIAKFLANLNNIGTSGFLITDSSSNITSNLNTLKLNDSKISSITKVDSGVISVTADQSLADNTVLAKIVGSYNLTVTGTSTADQLFDTANSLATLIGGDGIDTFNVRGIDTISDLGKGGADILSVSTGGIANANIDSAWTPTVDTINNGTMNINTSGLAVNLSAVNKGSSGYKITDTGGATKLIGSALGDLIIGGTGNDTLAGGLGNDTLTGNQGNNLLVFNTQPNNTTNVDLITDFVSGKDQLQFSKAVFTGLNSAAGTGNGSPLNVTEFVSSTIATQGTTASSHLIYNSTSGVLYYDADGNAAGAAVKVAILGTTTHPALVASDILIVA